MNGAGAPYADRWVLVGVQIGLQPELIDFIHLVTVLEDAAADPRSNSREMFSGLRYDLPPQPDTSRRYEEVKKL